MTEILSSYVAGDWHAPSGSPEGARAVHDATNGQLTHHVSSSGIDFAAVDEYARTTGVAELQKLTFHQRGVILKKLGAYLMERAKDYHEISFTTGTTKRD
ncbi:MAG: phenylacetic acid degradation bifunctional protein PaaZ, partial [Brevibacterium linens]